MSFDATKVKLLSFDVFGTLISVRDSSYGAFEAILREARAPHVDVKAFWEKWEELNIEGYWQQPYKSYRDICRESLTEAFAQYGVKGDAASIQHYFDAFPRFELYPDVVETLSHLKQRYRLAVVSNIDDDLLALTPLPNVFDLICTAERARGYKPDGTLFRYLLTNAGVDKSQILHSGQSQFTDMVGAKPLGLTVAWINRRNIALSPKVPKPDFTFPDIALVCRLVEGTA
ncbi:MAG: HAD hydrolase-like protein [Proteobacteria bacterium]|nr:HAD hydrolase-like protein [Pseudomonadota bacterium]